MKDSQRLFGHPTNRFLQKLYSVSQTQDSIETLKKWGYNSRFFAIFLIIAMHMLSPSSALSPNPQPVYYLAPLNIMLDFFSLPALTFLAGYFCIADLSKFRAQQLLTQIFLPYVMFNFLVIIFYDKHRVFLFEPSTMSWFLLCVIYWNCLILFFEHIKYNLAIAILISLLIGCTSTIGPFLSISRCFFFFPFFLLGYLMSQKKISIVLSKSFIIGIVIGIYIVTWLTLTNWIPAVILWGRDSYATLNISNTLGITARLCYYFLAFLGVFSFLSLAPKRETVFTSLGKNSLYAYLGQTFVLIILILTHVYMHKITIFLEIALIALAFLTAVVLSSDKFKFIFDPILRPKFLMKHFFIMDELQKPPKSSSHHHN